MVVGDKMPFNCALITLKAQGATGELPGGNDLDVESLAFATNIGELSPFTDVTLSSQHTHTTRLNCQCVCVRV